MVYKQIITFISILSLVLFTGCAMKTPKESVSSLSRITEKKLITDISFEDTPVNTIIKLKSSGALAYTSYILTNPTRLVVDISDANLAAGVKRELEINKGLVGKVKLHEKTQPPEVLRAEIELNEIAPRKVEMQGETLVIDIENPKESETSKVDLEAIKESLSKGIEEKLGKIEEGEEETQELEPEKTREELKFKGKRISFDFQDANVDDVVRLIADVSGMNFVIEEGVTGKTNVKLDTIPWDQALDLILKINTPQLVAVVDDGIYRIMKLEKLKKIRLDKSEEAKIKKDEDEAATAVLPLETKTIRLSYAKAVNVEKNVRKFMSSRIKSDALLAVDERTNSLIIKDVEKNISEIEDVIKTLDKPTPEVKIEARIVEVNDKFQRALGIQWGGKFIASPATGNATSHEFPNTISLGGIPGTSTLAGNKYLVNLPVAAATSGLGLLLGNTNNTLNLDIQLSALETENKARTLNKPELLVIDNETAKIQVGSQLPIITIDEQGKQSVTWKDVGIILEVTPQITADKSIFMKVKVEKSARGVDVQTTEGLQFSIDTTTSETKVMIRSGDTAVIGGLYFTSKSSIKDETPFLSRVPIFGNFFKRKDKTEERRELLIFLTPRVVEQYAVN